MDDTKYREAGETRDKADIVDEFRIVRLDEFGMIDVSRILSYDDVNKMISNGITFIAAYFTSYPRLMKPNTEREVADDRYKRMMER